MKSGKVEMYEYRCDFCPKGWIQCVIRPRELFPVSKTGDCVALEDVPIGLCDTCGERYYHASLLHQVEALRLRKAASRKLKVPVARYVRTSGVV